MAIEKFFSGHCTVSFGDTGDLVALGISRDGVRYRIEPHFARVDADDFGGPDGPPCDEQILGASAIINVEFTKYERTEIEKLTSFDGGTTTNSFDATAGTLPAIGSFMVQDALFGELVLASANETKTFSTAWCRYAFESQMSSRARSYFVGWYARINAAATRVLFVNS